MVQLKLTQHCESTVWVLRREWVLRHFSRVWLFATPQTVARQAPLSMGFSRQENWSGVPCPPPEHLSSLGTEPTSPALAGNSFTHWATWESSFYLQPTLKESESEVAQSCPTLCNPMDCSLSGSSVHGIFQTTVLEWIAISFSRGSSQPRNRTRVSRIAGRCFTVWATREAILINHMLSKSNRWERR